MSGWPDPDKPGVPLHPEQNSEGHVWRYDTGADVFRWVAANQWYEDRKGRWFTPAQAVEDGDTYLGRIVTPAEVAAREAKAFQRGAEAGIKAAAEYCHGRTTSRSFGSWADAFEAAERGIRALPVPTPEDKA